MLLYVLIFLVTALYFVSFSLSLIDSMHFFQLNSYRFDTHVKWLSQNPSRFLAHAMIAVLMLICIMPKMNILIKMVMCIVLFAVSLVFEKPKKAKKPLVYTARVKRMLVTSAVLLAVSAVVPLSLCHSNRQSILLLVYALMYACAPIVVLLANLINKPVELGINQHYINDAKRILKKNDDLVIIGVTGSYGKTSVKYYLNTLLRAKYDVLMTPESYNTPMGVVKTIRGSLKPTHEIFICEMGAKWVGDIKELCDIVHPKHGIITSIGPQHLESFKTIDAVKNTKFELADALPEDGMLFLNGDDKNIKDHGCNRPAFTYSVGGKGDYVAYDVSVTSKGTVFSVKAPDGETQQYTTRLIGRHNVLNIVGAIAVSHEMGISLSALKAQVRKLEGVPHRLQLTQRNGVTIIDDAYNSNPSGAQAALDALALFDGYKVLVTPGMVELGSKQEELNREFGRNAADVADYVVLVGEKQAVPIKAGLLDKGYDESKIFVAAKIEQALDHVYALNSAGKQKIILLENDLPDNY